MINDEVIKNDGLIKTKTKTKKKLKIVPMSAEISQKISNNNINIIPELKYNNTIMENSKTIFKTFFKVPIVKNQKFPPIVIKKQFRKEYLNVEMDSGFNNIGTQDTWVSFESKYDWSDEEGKNILSGYSNLNFDNKYDLNKINYGILTGSKNNVLVIDLDTSKDKWKSMGNNHPFITHYCKVYDIEPNDNFYETIENIVYKLNTFSVKTPSGGFHLYFRIEKNSIRPTKNSKLELDIKSEGGYVVGFNCKTDKGQYDVFTDVSVKDITNNEDDFLDIVYIYDKSPEKQKTILEAKNKKRNLINRAVDMSLWEYDMNEEIFNSINMGIKKIQDTFFNSKNKDYQYDNYFKITTFFKMFDKKELWIEYCKNNNGYNYGDNNKIWDNINIEEVKNKYQPRCIVSCILSMINKMNLLPLIKYRKLTENIIKPDLNVNSKDTKGLADVLELDHNKNYVIQSGTRSGKTYLVNKYHHSIEETPILSIVSRCSLSQEHQRVFLKMNDENDDRDYINYADKRKENLYQYEGKNLIIQIDSLNKIRNYDFSEYIIFVDELQSVFEYLDLSTTLNTKRKEIEEIFIHAINTCKQFIGVDADIQDTVLDFLKPKIELYRPVSPNINFEFVKNSFCPYENIEAQEIYSYDEILRLISIEDKFMVCCDSAQESHNLKNSLLKKFPSMADTWNIDTTIIDRLYEGDMDLDKIECLIFSPKIIYGLDSTMRRKVFCLFKGHTIPAKSMLQQLSRCRSIEKIYFHFINKNNIVNNFEFNTPDEVINRIHYLDKYSNKIYDDIKLTRNKYFENTVTTLQDEFYNNRMAKHLYNYDSDRTNKYYHFINGLKKMKIKVISNGISKSFKQKLRDAQEVKEMTKLELENHFKNNIDNEDYQYYTRINDILKIPKTEWLKDEFKQLFIDPQAIHHHLNFCNLVLNETKDSENKFMKNLQSNYSINVSWSDENRVLWLKKLMDDLGIISSENLTITKKLDNCKKYENEYIKLFRDRSKFIDFSQEKELIKTIKKTIETLTGEKLYRGKQMERTINKKRIQWTDYIIQDDIVEKNKNILKYRDTNLLNQKCLIED